MHKRMNKTSILSPIHDHTMFNSIEKAILVASYRRSGTHLTIDLLRRQFAECRSWKYWGEPLRYLYLEISEPLVNRDSQTLMTEELALKILSRAKNPLIKTHDLPDFKSWLSKYPHWENFLREKTQIIYVARDPRKVLCSLHLFMQKRNPNARTNISDFIRQKTKGVTVVKQWGNHVDSWLKHPGVILLNGDEIISKPEKTLKMLEQKLNLTPLHKTPLLPPQPVSIWQLRWQRMVGVNPPTTAFLGRYKGKKPLHYQTAFSQEDIEFIKEEAGDAIKILGYSGVF